MSRPPGGSRLSKAKSWSPKEWLSLGEAVERIKGYAGSYDLACRDLLQHIRAGKLKSAAARAPRKSPVQRLILAPAFWDNLEIWKASIGQPIRVSSTGEGRPLGTFFNWAFFIRRRDLDKLYPVAPPTGAASFLSPSPSLPPRRKPGPAPTRDWQTVVARKMYRSLKDGRPVPTAARLAQFCEDTINHQPDVSDIEKLINRLLGRLLD